MDILSPVIGRGDLVYVTARLMDLIAGAEKSPASRPDVLTKEELQSCQNYRFYCRFWRALTKTFPDGQFVRSAGLYRGASEWHKRWPIEKSRYSSLILVAFLSSPFSTGQTIIEPVECVGRDTNVDDYQYRYVGAGVVREVADMVAMGKPVCLIEADAGAIVYRVVDRFALTPVLRPTKNCIAIVGEDPDASPYAPDCSAVEAALGSLKT